MTTKLISAFKRELDINGDKYTLTVAPEGFKLVLKGKRKGVELAWSSLVSGEAALVTALNATLASGSGRLTPLSGEFGRNATKH